MRREEYLADSEESAILQQQALQSKLWTALPAIVTAVDYTKFTISAQPALKGSVTDKDAAESETQLPMLVDVPLLFPNAGGWHLTFPVEVGDEVLIIFACRCIDAWWQSGGVQRCMERRMHDLSDGFAILAPYSQPLASEVSGGFSNNSVILRDDSKENYIELVTGGNMNVLHQQDLDWATLGNATVFIKGNADISVDGNVTIDVQGNVRATVQGTTYLESVGDATIKAPTITLDTPTVICTGDVQVAGTVTAANDCIGGGISLKSHVHTGVQTGGATTGGPQ